MIYTQTMLRLRYLILLLSTLCIGQTQQLDEVVIRAQRIQSKISPLSVTNIPQDSLRLKQEIGELLQSVPSLFISSQQNFSQDTRISIRGFGTRATFGIRGIKVLLDGIPMTTPDGQTQLDHIPLSTLGAVEVIRGLSSGLYGNASGGVILLKRTPIKNQQTLTTSLGEYGTRHLVGIYGSEKEKNRFQAVVEHKKHNGYRQWSGYENTLLNLANTFVFSSKAQLSLDYTFLNSPNALDAGGLTLGEVGENRRQARQRNLDYNAGEKVGQHQVSAYWQGTKWTAYGFFTQRTLNARLPFEYGGQIDLNRNYYGFGALQNGQKNNWLWQYGVEAAAQRDGRKRFKNILGEKGNITLNQNEQFYSFGTYGIVELRAANWRFRSSLRADVHQIELLDAMGANDDKRNLSAFSPSMAVFYTISTNVSSYIRWSTGFETPSLNELSANPTGNTGFNQKLNPQNSQEVELGLRLKLKTIDASITFFNTTTKDEILPYEIAAFPGQNFYRNIGLVKRKGIEATGSLQVTKTTSSKITYSYGSFRTADGKELPNVPKQQFTTGINHQLGAATSLAVDVRYVGKRFADSGNSVAIQDFWVLDAYVQQRWGNTTSTLGITNLSNTQYFDNIRINAFGGRYFEPAAIRQLFVRVKIQL